MDYVGFYIFLPELLFLNNMIFFFILKRALGNANLNARTEPYTANLSSAEEAIV